MTEQRPTILFDGECAVCNRWVAFVLRHERPGATPFHFAAFGSETGRRALETMGMGGHEPDTMFVIDGPRRFDRSDAIVRIARELRRPWRFLGLIRIIPRPIRDLGYRWFAANRRRFGGADTCDVGLMRQYAPRFLP